MASSRGRSTVTERRERRTFVFGSSTPRDLSYMSKVPPTLRTYDSKPLKTPPLKKEETLTHYMRQARSLTPHLSGSRDGSCDQMRRSFAFGSSTPRQFSHLSGIQPELRVYDVKIRPKVDKRSYTTPVISSIRSRTVPATARVPRALPPKPQKAKRRSEDDDDEIASEPDFVQDRYQERQTDFMQSIKKKLHADQSMKKMQHPKENGTSSPAKETAVVRKERRVIRTTSNEDGKKVEKIVESVKRSFPKRSNTIEDEVVDLPVETTQPCIVPQTISTAASELFAKSAPTIRPINDSSEVIVVYDEKPPEEHLGGFLGELAATATERKDIIDQAAALKGVMMDQMESALTKAATDDEQHATGGKGAKNGLDGSEDNSHFADGNSKAESKLEVHTSLNATSEEQFDGRKHSLEVERTFDQSDSNNKIPSGEGSELSIGCSPQRTSPEQEAKLVLVSETKASTDLEHSPGQHARDQQQSSQYSPVHSEVILSVHESMHSTEGVVRPQDDSTHSSERIAGPIREGSSEDNTRSILESIHSDDGAQSMHESVHSTEGIRSIHDTDNSPHSEAGPIRETMNVTEGMYSSHESVHSPQEGVLFVQQSTHPAEGTAHSVSGDAHTLDDLTRSVHGSIHPAGNDTHPEHHSSHSNEDTPSSQPREDSFPKTEHPLEDQSYTEVTSRSVEHSDIHCSDSTVHSPGIHVEQSHVVDSSPGYEFTSGYDIERRSPDQGSYFVKSSRFEIGESRGDTDENSDEEAHAFRTTTGSKFSEEAIRLQRSEASLKERVEENIEEGEDVSVI